MKPFFSFMGGLIVKRKFIFEVPLDLDENNKCWGHITRFFSEKHKQFKLLYTPKILLNRRGGNDSFGGSISFSRIKIQIVNLLNAVQRVNNNEILIKNIKRVVFNEVYPHWFNCVKNHLQKCNCIEDLIKLDNLIDSLEQ